MFTLNLEKIRFEKKWNLQSPWKMQDFTLPSVGGKLQKAFLKKLKIQQYNIVQVVGLQLAGDQRSPAGRRSIPG
jgi:hypothetical protein